MVSLLRAPINDLEWPNTISILAHLADPWRPVASRIQSSSNYAYSNRMSRYAL